MLNGFRAIGPPLDHIGTVAGQRVPGLPADQYIRQSITEPGAYVVPGYPDSMPRGLAKSLSEEDLDALTGVRLVLAAGGVPVPVAPSPNVQAIEYGDVPPATAQGKETEKPRSVAVGVAGAVADRGGGGVQEAGLGVDAVGSEVRPRPSPPPRSAGSRGFRRRHDPAPGRARLAPASRLPSSAGPTIPRSRECPASTSAKCRAHREIPGQHGPAAFVPAARTGRPTSHARQQCKRSSPAGSSSLSLRLAGVQDFHVACLRLSHGQHEKMFQTGGKFARFETVTLSYENI